MDKLYYWCYKVLPLVYDDSLSYYEVLCKVVAKLNEVIDGVKMLPEELESIRKEIDRLREVIDSFDTKEIAKIVEKYLATMIFVEISDGGYIVYYIPQTWKDIEFNTTELDIRLDYVDEYGRLVLSY